jgi:hypothetical protein
LVHTWWSIFLVRHKKSQWAVFCVAKYAVVTLVDIGMRGFKQCHADVLITMKATGLDPVQGKNFNKANVLHLVSLIIELIKTYSFIHPSTSGIWTRRGFRWVEVTRLEGCYGSAKLCTFEGSVID